MTTPQGTPQGTPQPAEEKDVTASEVASYAFCAKAWHLERVLGQRASREAGRVRAAGVVRHATHGARVELLGRLGPRVTRWSRALLIGALVLLALAALALLLGGGR